MEMETTVKREITNEAFAVLLKNVYAWMALALGVTGVAAMYVSNNQMILSYLFEHFGLFMGLLIVELLLARVFTTQHSTGTMKTGATLTTLSSHSRISLPRALSSLRAIIHSHSLQVFTLLTV